MNRTRRAAFFIASALVVGALSACATQKTYWAAANTPIHKLDADYAACRQQAEEAVPMDDGSPPSLTLIGALQDYNELWNRADIQRALVDKCMTEKGYRKMTQDEVDRYQGQKIMK